MAYAPRAYVYEHTMALPLALPVMYTEKASTKELTPMPARLLTAPQDAGLLGHAVVTAELAAGPAGAAAVVA